MRQTNGYIIGFAAVVCVACSLALSVISGLLKERQETNRVIDRQKNILMAVGYAPDELKKKSAAELQMLYADSFEELVLDPRGQKTDKSMGELSAGEASGDEKAPKHLPLYRQKDPASPDRTLAFVYPVAGKGLWSTMYGYLAVKPDGDEVIGIAFYKHGETPGLGGEIEQAWFTNNFKGKQLYDGQKLTGVKVVKGKVADQVMSSKEAEHAVDGISGATLTANGVTKMMKEVPMRYEPFFKKLRANQTALFAPVGGAL